MSQISELGKIVGNYLQDITQDVQVDLDTSFKVSGVALFFFSPASSLLSFGVGYFQDFDCSKSIAQWSGLKACVTIMLSVAAVLRTIAIFFSSMVAPVTLFAAVPFCALGMVAKENSQNSKLFNF